MSQTQHVDVVVVGGGPAGSTAAGLLAKAGRRVLVIEKEKFPRYHIGESLVPGILPVIEELGATEKLEAAGFMRKYGITLLWGAEHEMWSVDFGDAGPHDYVFEVKRAEFDNLLLTHARTLGASVVEEATVRDVLFEDDRCVGLTYSLGGGEPIEVRADFVIDASGQARVVARKAGTVDWHEDLKNLAAWTYYEGGTRFEGLAEGNILIENHPDGWLWLIPFSDGTSSVGFVGPSAVVNERGVTPEEMIERRIASSREVKRMLTGATRVAGYRTARDWSYTCSQFAGPGYLIAGDAAAFIDPLFSTGVMLAMRSASSAAATADAVLDAPEREAELRTAYEDGYRSFLDVVRSFVRFFYDANREVPDYWEEAQKLVDPYGKLVAREDFIMLVSGLNDARACIEPGTVVNADAASERLAAVPS